MATLFSAVRGGKGQQALVQGGWLRGRTVDSQVAQGGARGTLNLDVWVLEQEEDGLEGVAVDFSDVWQKGST